MPINISNEMLVVARVSYLAKEMFVTARLIATTLVSDHTYTHMSYINGKIKIKQNKKFERITFLIYCKKKLSSKIRLNKNFL